jgi:hypothetical protein
MKKHFFLSGIIILTWVVFANANNTLKTDLPYNKHYIEYMAGIELLSNDKLSSPEEKAEKYRKLCRYTRVNADSVEAFIKSYSTKPDEWQKIQAAVMELIQTIK